MTRPATARERRANRRARFSRLLAATSHRLGMSDAVLARLVGTTRQKVACWRDDEDRQLPQAADIPAMGSVGVELLRVMAMEMGYTLTKRRESAGARDILRLVSDMAKENADVTAAILDGLATHDGRFTDEELERVGRELTEAEEVTAQARRIFDEEKQRRGAA